FLSWIRFFQLGSEFWNRFQESVNERTLDGVVNVLREGASDLEGLYVVQTRRHYSNHIAILVHQWTAGTSRLYRYADLREACIVLDASHAIDLTTGELRLDALYLTVWKP